MAKHSTTNARPAIQKRVKDNSDSKNLVEPLEPRLQLSIK
jgi:hypothetical protein